MRWSALPIVTLVLLAAPLAQRAVPSDVIRIEDPEPLPDISTGRTAPRTGPDVGSPAVQQPAPVTPDSRLVQPPALALPPERPAPPVKAPAGAPK